MRQLLPTFLIIGVAVTLIALLRSTFRYVVATERAAEAERVLPFLIGTIGGYYGLLTGFILSNTWGGVQSVRNSAMIEINALADMDRIALALPAPTGPVLRNDLAAYLRSVIDDDMKAMAKGQISEATTAAYGRLWSTVATARKDAGPWEAAMLARAFDKIGVVGDQRRIRILASTETLPMIVWAILLMGGAIILCGATIVSLRYGTPVREILMAVAGMLAIVLFSIYTMDRPFRHGYAPGVSRYELLWESFHGGQRQPVGAQPARR